MPIQVVEQGPGWVKVRREDGTVYTLPQATYDKLAGPAPVDIPATEIPPVQVQPPSQAPSAENLIGSNTALNIGDRNGEPWVRTATGAEMPLSTYSRLAPTGAPEGMPEFDQIVPPSRRNQAVPKDPRAAALLAGGNLGVTTGRPPKVNEHVAGKPAPTPAEGHAGSAEPTGAQEAPALPDGSPTSAEYINAVRGSRDEAIRLSNEKAKLEAADADKILTITDQSNRNLDKSAQDQVAADKKAKEEASRLYDEHKQMIQEYQNATVDQNRYWSSKSTGDQIGIMIAAALVDFGRAYAGRKRAPGTANPNMATPNPVLAMLQQKIDTDIQIQMEKINRKGKAVDLHSGLFAHLFEKTKDARAAYDLSKAAAYESVARQIDLVGLRSKSDRTKLGAEAAANELRSKAAGTLELHRQQLEDEVVKRGTLGVQQRNASTNEGQLQLERDKFDWEKLHPKGGGADPDSAYVINSVTGEPLYQSRFGTREAAKQQKYVDDMMEYRTQLQEYRAAIERCGRQFGVANINSRCGNELKQRHESLAWAKAKANDPGGKLTDKDVDAAKRQTGQFDSWLSKNDPRLVVDTEIAMTDRKRQLFLRGQGATEKTIKSVDGTWGTDKAAASTATNLSQGAADRDSDRLFGGGKSLLRDTAITQLEMRAIKGDSEAAGTLQAIAETEGHPAQKAAATALARTQAQFPSTPDAIRVIEAPAKGVTTTGAYSGEPKSSVEPTYAGMAQQSAIRALGVNARKGDAAALAALQSVADGGGPLAPLAAEELARK